MQGGTRRHVYFKSNGKMSPALLQHDLHSKLSQHKMKGIYKSDAQYYKNTKDARQNPIENLNWNKRAKRKTGDQKPIEMATKPKYQY